MKYRGQPQSGSVANQTASRNRYGQYFRDRVTPDETATGRRTLAWSYLAAAVAAWPTLTDLQRASWEQLGLLSRGNGWPQGPLSGQAAFIRVNVRRQWLSNSITADVPPREVVGLMGLELSISSLGVMTIAWSALGPASNTLEVQGSFPVSAGRSSWFQWRRFLSLGIAGAQPFDFTLGYVTDFGGVPAAGQRVFVRGYVASVEGLSVTPHVVASAVRP